MTVMSRKEGEAGLSPFERKPINIGKSTIPHENAEETYPHTKTMIFLEHLPTLPLTNTAQRKVLRLIAGRKCRWNPFQLFLSASPISEEDCVGVV